MTNVRESIKKTVLQSTRKAAQRRYVLAGLLGLGVTGFSVLLGWSAATAFQRPTQPVALTAIESDAGAVIAPQRPGIPWSGNAMGPRPAPVASAVSTETSPTAQHTPQPEPNATRPAATPHQAPTEATPAHARFDRQGNVIRVNGQVWTGQVYDGKPIRPVRTVRMLTTAYSPDERSCGKWADGITASGMSVWTNGMKLVAADRSMPFGTIVTIPGYNNGRPVPVLDRGGAIKGNRLDLLYPTHEIALQWGAQHKDVVVWEYVQAD